MAPKNINWKNILLGCFTREQKNQSISETKLCISSQRLSLSDISNRGSPFSLSDLSNSISDLHIFTLKELEIATCNFSRSNFLGEGGFGEVFKGFVDDKLREGLVAQVVAVKVLNPNGSQGYREWLAEVIFLGQLKHTHLVNLIGYCCEDEHRLLVYEYMERGNLEKHLFKGYSATLPWLTRVKIAIGSAKGLAFLHEEEKPVIHRDLKASNVLLDSEFNAKLSDFGLATDGPLGDDTHVSTQIMGTEGYAAPEYIMTGHLTKMSDIFSFGVLLLELLTGRRSLDKSRPSRERNLVKWARPLLRDPHKLDQIMDPKLEGQYSSEGAKIVASLAYNCLSYNPKARPTMTQVVKTLQPLLNLTKDIPNGPFVYIAPTEGSKRQCEQSKGNCSKNECPNEIANVKDGDVEEEKYRAPRHRRRHRNRHKVKALKARAVYSDTALYTTLGKSLY